MRSGVFRGKESSNRVKLFRLLQDLLNFGVLGFLWFWGGGRWVGISGGMGVSPHMYTCKHMLTHTHTHTHAHVSMYRNRKWPPIWKHPWLSCLSCLTYMCMLVCMHVHACIGHPSHSHTLPHPHPPICHPQGGTPGISKNSITLKLIKILQFHLKI